MQFQTTSMFMAVTAGLGLALANAAQADLPIGYSLADLGVDANIGDNLSLNNTSPNGFFALDYLNHANALNGGGQAVGEVFPAFNDPNTYVGSSATPVYDPAGASGYNRGGLDINDSATIVGRYDNAGSTGAFSRTSGGTFTSLTAAGATPTLVAPSTFAGATQAFGVNNAGVAVGSGVTTFGLGNNAPLLWDAAGSASAISVTDSSSVNLLISGVAYDINNSGNVVGSTNFNGAQLPFLTDNTGTNGQVISINAAAPSVATAVSDSGAFTGYVGGVTDWGARAPYIWTPDTGTTDPFDGTATFMSDLIGGVSQNFGVGTGINSSGFVVGSFKSGTNFSDEIAVPDAGEFYDYLLREGSGFTEQNAFIWDSEAGSTAVDLQTLLIPDGNTYDLLGAIDVNESGQILVHYTLNGSTQVRSAVLTPVIPEPATASLVVAVGVMVLSSRRRAMASGYC